MISDDMAATLKMGLDGMVLVILFLAVLTTLLGASRRPASVSIGALCIYAAIIIAVASCSSAPTRPKHATSLERCVALIEQGCGMFASCYGVPLETCLTERAGCVNVQGITQEEADVCAAAMEQAACGETLPSVCVGIAEPAPHVRSPQPESRDL